MQNQVGYNQKGAVLITSLLMLLALTIIGISCISNRILDQRMTGNMQLRYESIQLADSGISAAMSQEDNFDGSDQSDIYDSDGSNDLNDDVNATVNVDYLYLGSPPSGYSSSYFRGEYYTVDSLHSDSTTGANTHVYQGAIRAVLK